MRTGKITALFLLLICCSCGQYVKKETLEASERENKELKESLQSAQENYIKQNKELNAILAELTAISYQTTNLQLNVEQGSAYQMTQAEKISATIQSLKKRIENLEAQARKAREIDKNYAIAVSTIKNLQTTIANQEAEISLLKETINAQEATIQTQKDTIRIQRQDLDKQYELISQQRSQLEETVRKQVNLLYQAGLTFEEIADEGDFSVSGRRNKINVKEYRIQIYEKAKAFYMSAAEQGHSEANGRIASVDEKIEQMK